VGNVPSQLSPPIRNDVEWLEPELHEESKADADGRVSGKRTFSYVVRIHRAGDVPLGDATLPYYDPELRRYTIARAALGTVHVREAPT
ncbi:hypothetical protein ACSLVQ_29020, partial [Klebsiella pneumoniae]|uniref:hypothetical protein n=1 Tax=Klebsiella pneumoniae TaxID=573 RepID=UPI003EE2FBEA